MVKSLGQLEVLKIWGGKDMQVVMLIEELVEKEKTSHTMFPKLDCLDLYDLPQLVRFCSNCNSLGEVYEAQGLNGSGSQVVAATQSNLMETEVTQLVFPQVTHLELDHLPNFKGFFPQIHITKWPLLKRMLVEQCDKVKTFASEFPSIETTYGDNQLERQTQDPMFWIGKDSFPCLEELEFKQNDNMKEIWRGQYPGVYFPKLKDIKFLQFQNCSALLPSFSFFFQTLPNLEELDVSEASFHEIFQCERLRSEGRPTPSRLSELKLSKLNELMHLWKEESDLKSIFYNLRTLEVLECIKLVNLVPSVVSFENLQTLEISKCHGLENLVSYSTARSLKRLETMSITDCDLVEEIVKCMEDNVKDGIVYGQLQSLQLRGLPKLSSFCTGKCDLEFPSLKEVIVIGCPQMKYFSLGKTVTKELQNVQWIDGGEKGHWVSDLNSTVQDLYTQKVGYFGFESLKLSEFSELIQIWKRNSEELALPFKKIQSLEVNNCSSLSYLLTPSVVMRLEQLKNLKVKDCAAIGQVIMATRVGEVVESDSILFPQLKSISLEFCAKLSSFYVGSKTLKFPMLEEITVMNCLKMVRFTSKFSSEQEKETTDGRSEELLVKKEPNIFIEAFFCDEVEFPNLNLLKLSSINISQIWNKNHEAISSFKKLQHLEICNCSSLSYLLTPSMVLRFGQLKNLKVKDCAAIEQVIIATGVGEVVESNSISFPQLKSISLESCSELSSFYVGSKILKFPMLEEIIVKKCLQMVRFTSKFSSEQEKETTDGRSEEILVKREPNIFVEPFFCDKVEFPNLKILKLSSININQIWHNQISENHSIKNLKELVVEGCGTLKYLLTSSMVEGFQQLTRLKICGCKIMERVIVIEQLEEEKRMRQTFFPKLDSLVLQELPNFTRFCSGNFLEFPSLTELTISKCSMLKTFISSFAIGNMTINTENEVNAAPSLFYEKVKFPNLKLLKLSSLNINQIWNKNHKEISSFKKLQHLEVCNCSSLSYLLTPSMALGLVQLKDLTIKDCAAMEQVIMAARVEEVVETGLIFPQLDYILLASCSKLSCFYLGSNTLKFPMLEKIIVKNCLKWVRFTSKFLSDREREIADGRGEEVHVKEELDIFIETFFCDEVELPILKKLTLSSINAKQTWNSHLSSITSFAQNLIKLKVVNCSNLKYLFTFSILKSFVQLKKLRISGCEMMEVVILIEGTVEEEKICQTVFPKLETLTLNDLPQLATFCSNCDSLGKISDSGRVNFDTRSPKLLATQSTLVETETTKLVFSQVKELILRLLPKFKSFFPQMHITEWPSLKSLVVIECHGAQIVASEFSSTEMTHGDSQLERESQHLMFWISKATFPSLERLIVKWNDNIKIQCGHHPEEYFGKLKVLHLLGFPKQSAFLLPFFHSLPNLKKLLVKDAFFDEIFQCEEVTGEEKPVCGRSPLRKIRLSKLHELTHLWREESQVEVDILRNLKALKVQECSRLKNLVPSTVYFDNLRTLVVSECHGLVNLVRHSTAKSLGQLRIMKVANCEMIEEIVVCPGDAVKDGIVFTNLNCLQLKGLPRLESFCSGDCNFKFPALREVIVTECPNMQIFSKGELSTPRLHEVKLTGDVYEYMDKDIDEDIEKTIDDIFNKDEGSIKVVEDERCWVGNLNSTVQQLFKEKSARNSKKGNGENNDRDTKEDGN
ncbi:hypothetical protein SLEP1_g52690 [Rubroshorea leprosula]|uniref:Disease resistance protein At4g27190-like leucine-rich repeats domain-containing protein n=1 Tax=Rubroshorea leprosula TaxID=152421 RepID=A0AAV5M801_9ROSI|nr:hypothetical protein SLEP1_g52690 [Rubroshorea leprosula]